MRRLRQVPRGDGHVVIDIPGWKAPEAVSWPMRTYLRALGYDARPWGFGVNGGTPEKDAEQLATVVDDLRASVGPVSLVGWSLGGLIAREVARQVPSAVRRVVTYGTPAVGGPAHTVGASAFGPEECARIVDLVDQLDRDAPIGVPMTAILSRRDGVVAWRACLDRASTHIEHVEVPSSHLGLGVDPDVWEVVAVRLARPATA
ncbi:MAG: esterase/lipase family protein [Dermatophilaceae bacterium]